MYRKLQIKEFIVIPLILVVLILFSSSLHIFIRGEIGQIFFPSTHTIFSTVKLFFTSVIILIFLEFFISFDVPNNLLLARVLSLLLMVGIVTGLSLYYYSLFSNYNQYIFLYMYFLSIYPSQILSYYLQKYKQIRYRNFVSIMIITFSIMIITFLTITDTIR